MSEHYIVRLFRNYKVEMFIFSSLQAIYLNVPLIRAPYLQQHLYAILYISIFREPYRIPIVSLLWIFFNQIFNRMVSLMPLPISHEDPPS